MTAAAQGGAISFYGETGILPYRPASFVDVPFAKFTPALPQRPKAAIIVAVCTTAGLGYSVGEEVPWINGQSDTGAPAGLQCVIAATKVRALYGPGGYLLLQNTAAKILRIVDDSVLSIKLKAWG